MVTFLKDQWTAWAREWGLTHTPQTGWVRRNEQVVGERKGLLLRVSWGPDENPGLTVVVRFPKTVDVQRLRQCLIDDTALDVLPGKGSARRHTAVLTAPRSPAVVRWGKPPEFVLTDTSLTWRRAFPWIAPKSARVQAWVEGLVSAVARATPAFAGRCESCGVTEVKRHVLVDDVPMLMCSSCQQRTQAEGEMAERAYEMTDANHGVGAALAGFAAIVGATGWAAVSALTEREFAAAAIGIGVLVAWAYKQGAGRVDTLGRVVCAAFTLASVTLGDVLLFAWWVAKARTDIGFRLDAGWSVYLDAWRTHTAEQVVTLVLAGAGALVAFKMLERPKLRRTIRQADEPATMKRAA